MTPNAGTVSLPVLLADRRRYMKCPGLCTFLSDFRCLNLPFRIQPLVHVYASGGPFLCTRASDKSCKYNTTICSHDIFSNFLGLQPTVLVILLYPSEVHNLPPDCGVVFAPKVAQTLTVKASIRSWPDRTSVRGASFVYGYPSPGSLQCCHMVRQERPTGTFFCYRCSFLPT